MSDSRNKRRATTQAGEIAQEMGLKPGPHEKRFRGQFAKRDVGMNVAEDGGITVYCRGELPVYLSTDRSAVESQVGLPPFDTGDRLFDRRFIDRRGPRWAAAELARDSALRSLLVKFHGRWREQFPRILVASTGIRLERPYSSYALPKSSVEPLFVDLPCCVGLIRTTRWPSIAFAPRRGAMSP
jgi:hypothetical protein